MPLSVLAQWRRRLFSPIILGIKALHKFITTTTTTTTLPSTPLPPSPTSPPYPRNHTPTPPTKMPTTTSSQTPDPSTLLTTTLAKLTAHPSPPATDFPPLLRTAKRCLTHLHTLTPSPTTPPSLLHAARTVFEAGALSSIRARDTDAFTTYVNALQPFYALPPERFEPKGAGERGKVTGLWLLLLLTRGDFGGFHGVVEGLVNERGATQTDTGLEDEPYVGFAVRIERWLMEGSYDRVWAAVHNNNSTNSNNGGHAGAKGLGEEFEVFAEVLVPTIRAEIASCSEKAYGSLPVVSVKGLLFLESEGAVVEFAQGRGWVVRDGRVYFPVEVGGGGGDGVEVGGGVRSGDVIENAIGYARELETIV